MSVDPWESDPFDRDHRRARHPLLTLLALALPLFALTMPLPYVVVSPGPATDTLGKVGKSALITISGAPTYPTDGALMMTTVSVSNPDSAVRGGLVLERWLLPRETVVPRIQFYPEDQDPDAIERRDTEAMQLSQQNATTAALKYLGYDLPSTIRIVAVLGGSPAKGILKAGDELLAIDGVAVSASKQVPELVRKHAPGDQVSIRVRRGDQELDLVTGSTSNDNGQAFIGFSVQNVYTYPFDVKIRLDDVGGPSAGMMFALGIIDKLTPGSLTRGRTIAGTGTINDEGEVGEIGGIIEKLRGARAKGATLFLAPAGNCQDITYIPSGLQVVPVHTLSEAMKVLQSSGSLPSCPAR